MRQSDAERIANELTSELKRVNPLADVEHAVGCGDQEEEYEKTPQQKRLA
jgi:hypothetical protein